MQLCSYNDYASLYSFIAFSAASSSTLASAVASSTVSVS